MDGFWGSFAVVSISTGKTHAAAALIAQLNTTCRELNRHKTLPEFVFSQICMYLENMYVFEQVRPEQ